jgi:hypothetical protein
MQVSGNICGVASESTVLSAPWITGAAAAIGEDRFENVGAAAYFAARSGLRWLGSTPAASTNEFALFRSRNESPRDV